MAGTAAREINGVCKPSHPCPAASGIAARDALVRQLGGPKGRLRTGHIAVRAGTMRCRSNGSAGRGRTGAWCITADGVDLSCAMVRTGTVLKWARYWRDHRC